LYQLAEVIVQQIKIWVHIVAQPANRYIVAFHITILRCRTIFYSHNRRQQSREADSGHVSM